MKGTVDKVTRKEVICTLYVGVELTPVPDCKLLFPDETGQAQFKAALAGQNPRAILDTEDTDTLPAELDTILRQSSIGRERLFAAILLTAPSSSAESSPSAES